MTRSTTLAALRRNIARQDHVSPQTWPQISLGDAALDHALPGTGLATGALYEVTPGCHADFGPALGFNIAILSRLQQLRPGPIVWVQPGHQAYDHGGLYPPGLASFGIDIGRLLHVRVARAKHMLWTLEEALGEKNIAAAVGLLPDNDRTYDFTASRRLAMRASRHGVTAFILASQTAFAMATAAHMRWSVAAAASTPVPYPGQYQPGLGPPRWHVHLSKSRQGTTGNWLVEWDHATLSFRLAAALADRAPRRQAGLTARQSAAA